MRRNENIERSRWSVTKALLIIGQAPSRTSDPDEPLTGRSGRRLVDYLRVTFDVILMAERRNLNHTWNGGRFSKAEAVNEVAKLMTSSEHVRMLLLGRKVAESMGLDWKPLRTGEAYGRRYLMIPHPSGLNRWWNHDENKQSAVTAFRRFTR